MDRGMEAGFALCKDGAFRGLTQVVVTTYSLPFIRQQQCKHCLSCGKILERQIQQNGVYCLDCWYFTIHTKAGICMRSHMFTHSFTTMCDLD